MNDQHLFDTLQVFCPKALSTVTAAVLNEEMDLDQDARWRKACEMILDHLVEHDKALQGLTPGGSEYVNDRERCVRVIRERFAKGDEWRRLIAQRQSVIVRNDPCGTAWRQPDGVIFIEMDHTGDVFSVPAVREKNDG